VIELNINNTANVAFSNKLERLSKSALPVAVRTTLNSAAFDVKKNTMPEQVSKTFTERRKTFFKANSRVEMARGFNVESMQSKVGFINGGKNQAVRDLEAQEEGGKIGGRSFVPMDTSRISKSLKTIVFKSIKSTFILGNLFNNLICSSVSLSVLIFPYSLLFKTLIINPILFLFIGILFILIGLKDIL